MKNEQEGMEEKDIKSVKATIKKFLKDGSKVLEIKYTGKAMNASKYYHKVIFTNPLWFFIKMIIISICYFLPAGEFKNFFYRMLGMKIGKQVFISGGVTVDMGFPQLITIEDGTVIGMGATIFTHESTIAKIRIGRVRIGKRALIGINSIIRSGVSIGDNAVVAIGSVVAHDVADHELVMGVPATKIKTLSKPL